MALLFAAGLILWAIATLFLNIWRRLVRNHPSVQVGQADHADHADHVDPPSSLADEAEQWLRSQ